MCAIAADACSTADTAVLNSTTEPFSGIDTFVGLGSGDTTFVAGAVGGLGFDAIGVGNVLDLSGAPAAAIVKVNGDTQGSPGVITGLTAANDSFFGIQKLLGDEDIQSSVGTLPSSLPPGRLHKAYAEQLTGKGGTGSTSTGASRTGRFPRD